MESYILLFIAILLSAMFSASETAIFSLDATIRDRIYGHKYGKRLRLLLKNANQTLITILFGNMLVNIMASTKGEEIFASYRLSDIEMIIFITLIILIFGEIMPKKIAITVSERAAVFLSRFVYVFYIITKPISKLFNSISMYMLKKIREDENANTLTRDEVELVIKISYEEGVVGDREIDLLYNAVSFASRDVRSIMTPRTKVVAIDRSSTMRELISLIREHRYSHIPVYEDNLDNIIGIVKRKDILPYIYNIKKAKTIAPVVSEAYFVPETEELVNLLDDFQRQRIQFAIVVDEYGGVSGVVSLSDIVRTIMGDFLKDYEGKKYIIRKIGNGILFNADIPIEDFNRVVGTKFETQEFDTLAGFLIEKYGDIPNKKEKIIIDGHTFVVHNKRKMKISRILYIPPLPGGDK